MSYSDHVRKPNTSVLKQNNTDVYTETIKQLKKIEDITEKYNSITAYVNAHKVLHEAHVNDNKEKGFEVRPLGLLSVDQLRKIRKAVENMTSTILFNYDYKKKPWQNENYLSFVTLTLPYKQMHTDAVIRKSLITFIDNLRKTYGVKFYIWKAEPQENGNIHFHLILDKFIYWEKIQALWNRQLDKLGYIKKYASKRRKEGFVYKEWYFKKGKRIKSKKSYDEQLIDYNAEFENQDGFKNPKTTDIKSLEDIANTSRYIMKYMDKAEQGKRPILGKIWGLSNETKRLTYPKIDEQHPLFKSVIHMISNAKFKVVLKDDFFSVHAGKVHDIIKKKYTQLWGAVKKHYKTVINQIAEVPENIENLTEQLVEAVVEPIVLNPEPEQLLINYGHPCFWTNNSK